ncbi:MAG: hypothetical protein HYX78_09855 [Armatimonadetes bacterium]|nr:hypothetical protein [Armatimonadota bacterium]
MAITITRADVKRKCMIPTSETGYDSSIDSLISEMQAAVEYTIADVYLSDTGDTGLQAALKLGILEVISGEFLQQLAREFGNMEEFSVGGVTVGEMKERGPALVLQGSERLAPFLKSVQPMMIESAVQSTTEGIEPAFDTEEAEW